jgi:hypothetical protein
MPGKSFAAAAAAAASSQNMAVPLFADPVIMSRSRSYGVTDLGPDGIRTFFARHRCSSFCKPHWSRAANAAVHYAMSAGTTMELRCTAASGRCGCSDCGRQQRRPMAVLRE